ncbi:hypothetical protein BU26DRAFT_88407 [Trematosphaeria pertusa]|uniref:2EXR domain-containing protein n=1 Tax=Trematosphaeria pertusa TaxID=390896 RepID=A0A6A6I316_9PLEO|nr:uncharacterized protein BU26DRAFT_88407 [Trematosphaeria pertusa]KAF2244874.1 hypothetical protein BU26DRAFT_88407 [Trematosphaeria pertusa]
MSTPTTFHDFLDLPIELRYEIWEHATDTYPLSVTAEISTEENRLTHVSPPPAILSASSESRRVALKRSGWRKYCIGSPSNPASIYFNPHNMVLDLYLHVETTKEGLYENRRRITWTGLDAVLHDALRATQHLHLRSRDLRYHSDLLDWGAIEGICLDPIFCFELPNLKIISESYKTVEEINDGGCNRCEGYHSEKSCGIPRISCSRCFNAYRPTMLRSFWPFYNPQKPEEMEWHAREMRISGRIRLPIDDKQIAEWDDEDQKLRKIEEAEFQW